MPDIPELKIAYSYLRFSTSEQLKGDSLRRQIERSEAYAREHNLQIDHSLKLQDLGISAFKGQNASEGALSGFFAAIQSGRVPKGSTLLVESLDRLSRDQITSALTQFLQIINAGVTVVTLMDSMEYSTESINQNPGSLMMSIVIMMRAHEESASKSDRICRAYAQKRLDAVNSKTIVTSRGPSWLKLSEKEFVIIPERAALVRRVYQMNADGMGKLTIAKKLNSENVPTFESWRSYSEKPRGWFGSTIGNLLKNRAVLGYYQPGKLDQQTGKSIPDGPEIEGYYPPIISKELWYQANSRPRAPRGPRAKRVNNLFSGIVIDGYTGARMIYSSKGSSSESHGYRCYLYSDIRRLNPDLKGQSWPYAHFENLILNYLKELDWKTLINSSPDENLNKLRTAEASLMEKCQKLQGAIDRILDTFSSAENSSALSRTIKVKVDQLATELESVEIELSIIKREIEKSTQANTAIAAGFEEFKSLIKNGDVESRLRLQTEIRRRIESITVYRHGPPAGLLTDAVGDINWPYIAIKYQNGHIKELFINRISNKTDKNRKSNKD